MNAKRRTVIAGNWKMNFTPAEATAFINEIKPMVAGKDNCDIVCCVPATNLCTAVEAVKGTNIKIGAQNVHFAKSGAYTGETSADMLVDLGVEYVILGHSERRDIYKEDNALINKKVKFALAKGLKPVLCIGEHLEEREAGVTEQVIKEQLVKDLADISAEDLKKIIVAYEPVWAIGTGKTATDDQAEEMHAFIRSVIAAKYGETIAEETSILYGGSCNEKNAAELFACPDIDGGLIGGAALVAEKFLAIIAAR